MRSLFLLVAVVAVGVSARSKKLVEITEENWKDTLKGEWMLEFHAPWCPACKDLKKAWDSFADWSADLDIKVGEVDVTAQPGLSGRFLVTALPTIYHVKDGVFRGYAGPRDKEDFMKFIEEKKWTVVEPLAAWKYPDSPQMSVVATFFRLSMKVRDLHNWLIEEQGLPAWGSYAIFGSATLVLGCILGFLIVCVIDFIFPASAATPPAKGGKQAAKSSSKDKPAADSANGEVRQRKGGDNSSSSGSEKPQQNGSASPEKKKNK